MAAEFRRYDGLAVLATVIAVGSAVVSGFALMQQGDRPASWFVALLALAAMLGTYGAARTTVHRPIYLAVAGLIMVVLGVLGILSIGAPILVAGVLMLIAAYRARGDGVEVLDVPPDASWLP